MLYKFTKEHVKELEGGERKEFLDSPAILADFGLKKGMRIADIGCGTGYFAIPMSEIAGSSGMVFALDVQEEMINFLVKKLERLKIKNVIPLLMEKQKTPLPSSSVDFVLVANVLHEIENKSEFLKEARRILKDGGKLGIVEWKREKSVFKGEEIGPPLKERIPEEKARALLSKVFKIEKVFEAGMFHYGVLAKVIEVVRK